MSQVKNPAEGQGNAGSSAVNYGAAFRTLVILFFLWGFLTALNDILLPHVKAIFDLTYTQASLVQFCFFVTYGLLGIPSGVLVERMGHKRGIVIALVVMAIGALLFLPAASMAVYGLFLLALFVLATGVVILQTAANPFVARLGSAKTAASRLNLSQAFNSFGHTIAPPLGAYFILRDTENMSAAEAAKTVQSPYLVLAVSMLILAFIFSRIVLPKLQSQKRVGGGSIFNHGNFVWGIGAIFLYVGGEVAIGSYLVSFFEKPEIGGLTAERAGYFVSFYWGAAMVGRFLGSAILQKVPAPRVLMVNAAGAIALVTATMFLTGWTAVWTILAVGLFNSIMFPTIFTLAIDGLGEGTSRASGFLVAAIVGGAIVPAIMGWWADQYDLQQAFLIPAVCYAYILYYGYYSSRYVSPGPADEDGLYE